MSVLWRAVVAWWDDILDFVILNLLWLALSFTVVGIFPATAAMYQMAAYSVEQDLLDWRKFFAACRALFLPAWKWGILQILVYGIGLFNFLYYQFAEGDGWLVLRLVWFGILFVWTVLNIFYWPFYLQQTDRRLLNTYRNIVVMLAVHLWQAAFVVVFTIAFVILSVLTGILLAFAMMPIVTLVSTLLVYDVLKPQRQTPLVTR